VNELTANIAQSKTHSTSTSDLTNIEKEVVKKFFASIMILYGASRYHSAWYTAEIERDAMRLWARDVIKYSWSELNQKLMFAKSMMHQEAWRHPDIATILNGDKQAGAAGQAALSYRPASEVLNALPKPPKNKAAGMAVLNSLREGL